MFGMGAFAGGFAQGMTSGQELALKRQQMQNQRQRQQFAMWDKQREEAWKNLDMMHTNFVHGQGMEEAQFWSMKPVTMLMGTLRSVTQRMGFPDDIDARVAAMSSWQDPFAIMDQGKQQQTPQQRPSFPDLPEAPAEKVDRLMGPQSSLAGTQTAMAGDTDVPLIGEGIPSETQLPEIEVNPPPGAPQQQQGGITAPAVTPQRGPQSGGITAPPVQVAQAQDNQGGMSIAPKSSGKFQDRMPGQQQPQQAPADDGWNDYELRFRRAMMGAGANPDKKMGQTEQRILELGYKEKLKEHQQFLKDNPPQGETGSLPGQSDLVTRGELPPLPDKLLQTLSRSNINPDQLDFQSQMYAFGNTDVVRGLTGRDKDTQAIRRLILARATDYWRRRGMSAREANMVQLEFAGMRRGAATLGVLEARMTGALQKAKNVAPQVLQLNEAMNKPGRTQIKSLNKLFMASREELGDEDVVAFKIALETLASNYGTALGMGSSVLTDFQTKRAQEMLDIGWSKGQIDRAVKQIITEIDREQGGVRQSMKVYLGSERNQAPAPLINPAPQNAPVDMGDGVTIQQLPDSQ